MIHETAWQLIHLCTTPTVQPNRLVSRDLCKRYRRFMRERAHGRHTFSEWSDLQHEVFDLRYKVSNATFSASDRATLQMMEAALGSDPKAAMYHALHCESLVCAELADGGTSLSRRMSAWADAEARHDRIAERLLRARKNQPD